MVTSRVKLLLVAAALLSVVLRLLLVIGIDTPFTVLATLATWLYRKGAFGAGARISAAAAAASRPTVDPRAEAGKLVVMGGSNLPEGAPEPPPGARDERRHAELGRAGLGRARLAARR